MGAVARIGGVVQNLAHRFALGLSFVALFGLALLLTTDIVMRGVAGRSLGSITDYSLVALSALVFASIYWAEPVGAHVRMELFDHLNKHTWYAVLKWLCTAALTVVVAWTALENVHQAVISYESGEFRLGVSRVSMWPIRAVAAVFLIALAVELFAGLVAPVVRLVTPRRPVEETHD